jgi:single-stranded DNA-binding protein
MHSQFYLTGRLADTPEPGTTKKGKLWIKLLLETELVRSDGRGGVQVEAVTLPVSFFSREAETVKNLQRGEELNLGCHLYGTKFETDGGTVKNGVQIIADAVFTAASRKPT